MSRASTLVRLPIGLSGDASGNITSTGTFNTLTVGRGAGSVSTNTAVGASALAANTTGGGNQAFGVSAGAALTTGNNNTALGRLALATATTPDQNTAVGYAALYLTTTGQFNTGVGGGALQNNTTASNNTAVGYQAGYSNTTGVGNTAVGYQAGYANTTQSRATCIGHLAGVAATGESNTLIGAYAGYGITTGESNTCVGGRSFLGNNEGAGFSLTTGTYNNFFGGAAGGYVTTGSKNTILGNYDGNQNGLDIRTASNYIVLSDGDGNPRQWWDSSGIVRGNYLNSGFTFSDNFNSYITPGFYRADSSASNAPSGGNFWAVIVTGNASNVVTQLASPLQSSTLWVRSYNAAWSAWTQL